MDLARAFMRQDVQLFRQTCIQPFGGGQSRIEYSRYLEGVTTHFQQDGAFRESVPDNPKEITQVFAARHFSADGPASYGYAAYDFQDVMFVDIEVLLNNGMKHVKRTLVIEDRNKRWYALPVLDIYPLLSDGVYDEAPSKQLYATHPVGR